ncbi:MAG: hypothetical protein US86_C0013G0006 [Candidatus Daviesbacteria bacterium GW2011_GWA2_38_24]|uniref:Uncharacterized protein n=1 Tax=Candidatus Daviesbacteria bacterium GW2011_GWA2_38_24 TaxID=1618422 RepID=A0A0G0JPG0_9BACT|nr:MAG: hypothetical protein US86_C0013G0006 [Candidatus Daviesbacteria bacterium GW2011_GWA2_38_24]OGE23676.1 MAG: hypothetical protein A2688_00245 [Candidatus Daviesbacteria bacterium RIFCSPHIGHO2_01_FULL_38_8]
MSKKRDVWFKPKFGYRWFPVSWQGWVVFILFVSANILYFFYIDARSNSFIDTLFKVFPFIVLTSFIKILISIRKQ